jgi:hypothetical protein
MISIAEFGVSPLMVLGSPPARRWQGLGNHCGGKLAF